MIKKTLFADELMQGMQRELLPSMKKQGMTDLVKAAEYLHSAMEIFEEAGMTAKAEQILKILEKIAAKHDTKVRTMPSIKELMQAGVTLDDMKNVGSAFSRARVNTALRKLNYSDEEIQSFLGNKFMTAEEAQDLLREDAPYNKFMDWMSNPATPIDPRNPQAGEEISFQSLPVTGPGDTLSFKSMLSPQDSKPGKNELVFKSIAEDENEARKPRKPKDPTTVSDRHTHGLTSEKMVANLEGHGTMFNLADDGAADDLLDLDLNEAAVELLADEDDKTFED